MLAHPQRTRAALAVEAGMSEYKIITDGSPNELWASGFYHEEGRAKAQSMIDDGYWHRFMFASDKHKKLVVVPVQS
jgi:hypothetical protein